MIPKHTGAYILLTLSLVSVGWLLNESKKQESQLKERLRESQTQEARLTIQLTEQKIQNQRLSQQKNKTKVVTKPDGTRIETTEVVTSTKETSEQKGTTVVSTQDTSATSQTDKRTETSTRSPLSKYSVTPEWRALDPYGMPTGASVGARLGALPLWVESGWDRKAGAHVGLRIEF